MRILALTRYDDAGASSRVRFLQYLPGLRQQGFVVDVQPLLSNDYVASLNATSRRSHREVLAGYARRINLLLRRQTADLVWTEKELFPWFPSVLDPGLLGKVPYVVDYDDAVFHNYDKHRYGVLRLLYREKIPEVMRRARVVVVGNDYLGRFARQVGALNIVEVPSVVDGDLYKPRDSNLVSGVPLTVGWIGSPSTQKFLTPILSVLQKLCADGSVHFVSIGANWSEPLFKGHRCLPWALEREHQDVAVFDVGIMPVNDGPFERGKCGYKLVQYMACGVPVIASPIGVNSKIVQHGINGFLASSATEWGEALCALLDDRSLRRKIGNAGRLSFEEGYSLSSQLPRMTRVLRGCV